MKYLLYIVLAVTDAWLLSHPNLIGRAGIWFYKYHYFSSFPTALLTVSGIVGAGLGLSMLLQKLLPGRLAVLLHTLLLAVAIGLFFYVFLQFSSGSYRLTGQGFRWGVHLLPALLVLIFLQGIYEIFRTGQLNQR